MDNDKVIEYQLLRQSLDEGIRAIEDLSRRKQDYEMTLKALEDISPGKDIVVPLGPGVYIEATVKDSKPLVSVGDNIHVSKDFEATKSLVKNQIKLYEQMAKDVESQVNQIAQKLQAVEKELQKILREQKSKKKHEK